MKTPCEIFIWYVLPGMRRELAVSMVRDHGLSQARAACMLGVTGAAVSQYIAGKRGEMAVTAEMKKEIGISAGKIVAGKPLAGELCRLCNLVKDSDMMGELYRKHDGSGPCPGGAGVKA